MIKPGQIYHEGPLEHRIYKLDNGIVIYKSRVRGWGTSKWVQIPDQAISLPEFEKLVFDKKLVFHHDFIPDSNGYCTHDFKTYVGFFREFQYCIKCDMKINQQEVS